MADNTIKNIGIGQFTVPQALFRAKPALCSCGRTTSGFFVSPFKVVGGIVLLVECENR
jgi:hypothetical protein